MASKITFALSWEPASFMPAYNKHVKLFNMLDKTADKQWCRIIYNQMHLAVWV